MVAVGLQQWSIVSLCHELWSDGQYMKMLWWWWRCGEGVVMLWWRCGGEGVVVVKMLWWVGVVVKVLCWWRYCGGEGVVVVKVLWWRCCVGEGVVVKVLWLCCRLQVDVQILCTLALAIQMYWFHDCQQCLVYSAVCLVYSAVCVLFGCFCSRWCGEGILAFTWEHTNTSLHLGTHQY